MALIAGTRIGSFEILAPIGAGGMGEVYRARDIRLKRDVALKVLPEALAHDLHRMERFRREAELLASLNHPNIATIHGVEMGALVMELVPGASPKGPLPFDEAWKIALQIADALEYAHERGVIHRDLKPANVKVTPEGVVKLLDFGLAKAFNETPDPLDADPSDSPTATTLGLTVRGTIMGTAAYMSPEQAKGKPVDKRADIWSWGVVLYELLAGEQMFAGDDPADTLAQVLTKEPDLKRFPPQVQRLLQRCLEKDPKRRLRDIGEARFLLDQSGPEIPEQAKVRPTKMAWIFAAVLVGVALIVAMPLLRRTSLAARVQRYTLAVPDNTTNLHSFAISPDGRFVAMATEANGQRELWLRGLDAFQAQPMPGTDDATYPFWSPDSRYIGFFAHGMLKKIAARGGPAQALCDAADGRGGSWNREDVILFSPSAARGGALQRVSAAGGVPADVMRRKGISRFPVFLPDGRHFLYLVTTESPDQNGVYLSSLEGGENRRVLPDVSSVVFMAGRLLFIRENTLVAQPFDLTRAQTIGDVYSVAKATSLVSNISYAPVTVSETGVLLYESGGVAGASNQIAWYDRSGKLVEAIGPVGPVFDPAISPDEKAVLFPRISGLGADLWLKDLARGTEQRVTTDASINNAPVWSRRGDRIAFSSNRRAGTFDLYQKTPSTAAQDEVLLANGTNKFPTQWSRDNRFIVYTDTDLRTKRDIWVLPMEAGVERQPVAFLRSEFNEIFGQLSPDSHWMAYTSDESGQREVYVRPFPTGKGQWRISIAGGEQPRWRGDGKELFFRASDGTMTAVMVKAVAGTLPSFEPAAPARLFEVHLASPPVPTFEYDVSSDGKRFLLNTLSGSAAAQPLNVVVNWDAGLKK